MLPSHDRCLTKPARLQTNSLDTAAKNLLRRLDAGQALVRDNNGFRCGTAAIDGLVVDRLLAQDLIATDGPRRLVISEPGRRFLERAVAKRETRRAGGGSEDGFAQQNRLMAKVKLPEMAALVDINLNTH